MREYKAGEIIAKKNDECLEVLFVYSGKYSVGYEINKKERLVQHFG